MKAELVNNTFFATGSESTKRSRLEVYFDILHVLAYQKPLRLTHITQKANLNGAKTKQYLTLLTAKNLIAKTMLGKSCALVYSITPQGLTALRKFEELTQTLPLPENENTAYSFTNQTERMVIAK
jgi:predicted transcriptional regulator